MQLSRRLKTLADCVPEGSRFVDVGTDHAYIPIYLASKSKMKSLIATDVAMGPIESAKMNVLEHHFADKISIRLGNGLAPIEPGEVDTVLIAGMGGHTAVEILTAAPSVVNHIQKLIIQPMNASHLVRRFLDLNKFFLQTESVIEEDGRFYEIIVANRLQIRDFERQSFDPAYEKFRSGNDLLQFAYEFGPLQLTHPSKSFVAMMVHARDKWKKLLRNIAKSESAKAVNRQEDLVRQIQFMNEWLRGVEERMADE